MQPFKHILLLVSLLLITLATTPAYAAIVSGTVAYDGFGPVGPVYIQLQKGTQMNGDIILADHGIRIPAPGNFTIQGIGMPDGLYSLNAFMDSNDDGAFSTGEAFAHNYVEISGSQISTSTAGNTTLDLTERTEQALPATSIQATPSNGAVLLTWDYPLTQDGAIAGDGFTIPYSMNGFTNLAGAIPGGSLLHENGSTQGRVFITGLIDGVTYQFRVNTLLHDTPSAVSPIISATVGTPTGGHTVTGTVSLTGLNQSEHDFFIGTSSDDDKSIQFVRYSSSYNGMVFSIPGVQDGLQHLFAFIDNNDNGVPDTGDYFCNKLMRFSVAGSDVSGILVNIATNEDIGVHLGNLHTIDSENQHKYYLLLNLNGATKRPTNCSIAGPQIGTWNLSIHTTNDLFGYELNHGTALFKAVIPVPLQPSVGDTYTVTVTFEDGTSKAYNRTLSAIYAESPAIISPTTSSITAPPDRITWAAPTSFPTNGFVVGRLWSSDVDAELYKWMSKEYISSTGVIPVTYIPQIFAGYQAAIDLCDANLNCISKAVYFVLEPAAPTSITVPPNDGDGSYVVSWTASTTPGAFYELEEATNPNFMYATRIQTGYLSTTRNGRLPATSYYYRVRTKTPSYAMSDWRTASAPCKVSPASPAILTLPSADADGSYAVSWTASAGTGVSYTLEEATNDSFTVGKRVASTGTTTSTNITGRHAGVTYYYRIRADKIGFVSSAFRVGGNGCLVGGILPTAGTPTAATVPTADADGTYIVGWVASSTTDASYELQEATSSTFSTGLRTINAGTALSTTITNRTSNFTYYYRVRAIKSGFTASAYRVAANGCAVPGTTVATPGTISVPLADLDGAYTVSWTASATAGVTYILQEATNSTFSAGLRTAYTGASLAFAITGRTQNLTYYYRVSAIKQGMLASAYRNAAHGCAVPGTTVATPGSISVPIADTDGAYTVNWATSATVGVTYILQEATNPTFSAGLKTAYTGTSLSASITGRPLNVTYFYRVLATRPGMLNSSYRTAANGCAVPGTTLAATPVSLSVPVADSDGSYMVSWGASATAGVAYELQEASNSAFTTGLRTAYAGTALSAAITGRSQNVTYFYRVVSRKPGMRNSTYRLANNGCAVPGIAIVATPASITVPLTDTDGSYAVGWGASATAGATYLLQEATNSTFTSALRTAYAGTSLSAAITGRSQNVTYYYRIIATKPGTVSSSYRTAVSGCAVPGSATVAAPASITVPVADSDGAYTVSWGASATAGGIYLLQEATNSAFTTGLRTAYTGAGLSAAVAGRGQNQTYYYRVMATKPGLVNSSYRTAVSGCAVPGSAPVAAPASTTVPGADSDGAYTVSWGASATAGAIYLLQEATNSTFTTGLRTAYTGTALSAAIAGRGQNQTYFYRVVATKPGMMNSTYRSAANGCAVPGSATVTVPASITVPVADPDGAYIVSWGASATVGGVYLLQEATNSTFTTGLRTAYTGTALSAAIAGRGQNQTYYYRVMATKPGVFNSSYRTAVNGCAVPGGTVSAPASIAVPTFDGDGSYAINWEASATAGVTYLLQEATNSTFTSGLRTAYVGTGLSAAITGRQSAVSYYYRVLASKPGMLNSAYRTASNWCEILNAVLNQVVGEVHEVSLPQSQITLNFGPVVPGSVKVRDSESQFYYVQGIDYIFNSASNRVEILDISPGTALEISYQWDGGW